MWVIYKIKYCVLVQAGGGGGGGGGGAGGLSGVDQRIWEWEYQREVIRPRPQASPNPVPGESGASCKSPPK